MAPLLVLAAIGLPFIDLPSNCHAEERAIPPGPEHRNIYQDCMRDELAAHEELLKRWTRVPAGVRQTCAEMGRLIGSYIEIYVCVDIDTGILAASSQRVPAPRQKNH